MNEIKTRVARRHGYILLFVNFPNYSYVQWSTTVPASLVSMEVLVSMASTCTRAPALQAGQIPTVRWVSTRLKSCTKKTMQLCTILLLQSSVWCVLCCHGNRRRRVCQWPMWCIQELSHQQLYEHTGQFLLQLQPTSDWTVLQHPQWV